MNTLELLGGLVVSASLAVGAQAPLNQSPDPRVHQYLDSSGVTPGRIIGAWWMVCALTEEPCDIPMPSVMVVKFNEPGLRGLYTGGNVIFVSEDLKGETLTDTIIHEMVHYIDHANGVPIPGPAFLVCLSEDRAFYIQRMYQRKTGRENKALKYWQQWYPYCQGHPLIDPERD